MRRMFITAIACLWLVDVQAEAKACSPAPGSSCGNHGTAVQFVDKPADAARQARAEEKLVLVLHVSGIFEDPGLT